MMHLSFIFFHKNALTAEGSLFKPNNIYGMNNDFAASTPTIELQDNDGAFLLDNDGVQLLDNS